MKEMGKGFGHEDRALDTKKVGLGAWHYEWNENENVWALIYY